MTQEDKELLLRDLCCRLLYGVIVQDRNGIHPLTPGNTEFIDLFNGKCNIKSYLRPMSSMTEEEKVELRKSAIAVFYNYKDEIIGLQHNTFEQMNVCYNWLNSHHFDYRDLISKDLAFEAPEGMYG